MMWSFFSYRRKQIVFSHYYQQVVTVIVLHLLSNLKSKVLVTKRHCKWRAYKQFNIINTTGKDCWNKIMVFGCFIAGVERLWCVVIWYLQKKKKQKNRPPKHTHTHTHKAKLIILIGAILITFILFYIYNCFYAMCFYSVNIFGIPNMWTAT